IMLEERDAGGRLHGLVVKAIMPMGPMAATYGLAPGDEIVEVGQMRVRDYDIELMKALTYEAYSKNQPLVIVRNGQELKLSPNSALTQAHPNLFAAPGATPTANNPAAPGAPGRPQQQGTAPMPQQQI